MEDHEKIHIMDNEICPISGETRMEEIVNHWTHRVAMLLSIVGLPILILYGIMHGDEWRIASYSIFGVSLVLLYVVSTYYHGCQTHQTKQKLRVIDHACIFLLIAGSYTPFVLGPLRESIGWALFATEWTIAVVGISLKIFAFNRTRVISLIAYLAMGWLIVFWWSDLSQILSETTLTLIAVGGLSYTLGVIFFLWESLPFNHAIWHVFVFGGSACHYIAILLI